jgi:GNAT superfamily N-acetyltransferase
MPSILQMSKAIVAEPVAAAKSDVVVRNYADPADIEPWLTLRDRAFAREQVGVRKWNQDDFQREFLEHWWWQPERMWLAEVAYGPQRRLAGSITLAMRGEPENARPVVHWLVVDPTWRRRGIGRLLLEHLETAAWQAGYREIFLETQAGWKAAAKFYEALGFQIV